MLFEAGPDILGMFPESLRRKAKESLTALGVDVRTGVRVTDIRRDGVTYKSGEQQCDIAAETVLWTAGVKASSLGPS